MKTLSCIMARIGGMMPKDTVEPKCADLCVLGQAASTDVRMLGPDRGHNNAWARVSSVRSIVVSPNTIIQAHLVNTPPVLSTGGQSFTVTALFRQ